MNQGVKENKKDVGVVVYWELVAMIRAMGLRESIVFLQAAVPILHRRTDESRRRERNEIIILPIGPIDRPTRMLESWNRTCHRRKKARGCEVVRSTTSSLQLLLLLLLLLSRNHRHRHYLLRIRRMYKE
jgi:hypothetical protein